MITGAFLFFKMFNFIKFLGQDALRKPALISLSIAIITTVIVIFTTGQIYGAEEAKDLLTAIQKTSLYYGSTIAGASATILALMLTMFSMVIGKDDPNEETFIRLHAISTLCVLAFIGALFLLLCISFPVVDFEKVPSHFYKYIFYIICGWNGMLAAYMIATILILRDLVSHLIGTLSPDFDEDGNDTKDKKKNS